VVGRDLFVDGAAKAGTDVPQIVLVHLASAWEPRCARNTGR
jgi:hypothetical protein